MGQIVNLRRERKRKARAADERRAEANRALFGRSRTQRDAEQAARVRSEHLLDGHLRDIPEPSGGETER